MGVDRPDRTHALLINVGPDRGCDLAQVTTEEVASHVIKT